MTTDHEYTSPKRLGFWPTFLICGLIGGGCLVGLAVVLFYCSVPLEISKETTYITEPRTADGTRIDYLAAWEEAIYPENMATEENGYRMIVEHLGAAGMEEMPPGQYAMICEKLGLDADKIEPDMTYEESWTFLEKYVQSDDYDEPLARRLWEEKNPPEEVFSRWYYDDNFERVVEVLEWTEEDYEEHYQQEMGEHNLDSRTTILDKQLYQPWALDDMPMMERWLEESGPALDMVAEAVRKPSFCLPLAMRGDETLLLEMAMPHYHQMRAFARGLAVRANYRFGTGDIDGAIDDIIACLRLGRHVSRSPSLVTWLVGLAVEGIGMAHGPSGSLGHLPTKEQLQRFADEFNALPPRFTWDDVIQLERYEILDAVQVIAQDSCSLKALSDFAGESHWPVWRNGGIDWNIVARRVNENFNANVTNSWDWESAKGRTRVLGLVSIRARSEQLGDAISALVMPACDMVREAERRMICSNQLQRITLAMLLYEADHGTLPPAFTVDKNGNPLHSWRVLLLPYLGEQELHDKIRLDEPWDSEHNAQFHDETVDFYRCPSHETAGPGESTYSVVVGPDMPFEGSEGKALADFGPKSADMILVVERWEPVCWMDPTKHVTQEDAERSINVSDPNATGRSRDPAPGFIGSEHPGGANFGRRDGSVYFLSETIPPDTLEKMLNGTNDDWDY